MNPFNILSNEMFIEKMKTQNALLASIASNGGGLSINSYADIQRINRMGLAPRIFNIGDQITCSRGASTLTWDIIDFDKDIPTDKNLKHSITLHLHDCFASIQFCARQALWYAETELPAGMYNFKVIEQPWHTADNGKTFCFTLTQPVPAGGQIVLDMYYNTALAGTSVKTYASITSTDEMETATISEGGGGTALVDTDGQVENLNHVQRYITGSNSWIHSAIRQNINSNAAAGSVWTPQTKFDRPPSWVNTQDGFLYGVDPEFLAVIGYVDKITALNTVTDGGGSIVTSERFFLPSRSEVYGGPENGILEGEPYAYYANNSNLNMAGTESDGNRIKYRNGVAQYWWLRSPNAGNTNSARYVYPTGDIRNTSAYVSHGVAPACCIV